MFGYVIANPEGLTDAQKQRYRDCYCGLCHTLHRDYSGLSRLSLNYDMTFLVLLLSSLYEPEETHAQARCIVHPIARHSYWFNDSTHYCAAMNIALAYYNCIDDWNDDRRLIKLGEAQLFRRAHRKIAAKYPRQTGMILRCLEELSALERSGVPDPDRAANCFGRLMGELFVPDETDYWAPVLRIVGEALGRFIYILDAAVDLQDDLQHGRYNPLSDMARDGKTLADFQDYLTLLIGECSAAFEQLPLLQDVDLMRNILYSGVWTKYLHALNKQTPSTTKEDPT